MKSIISRIDKKEIEAVTIAGQKLKQLEDRHNAFLMTGGDIARQLEATEAEIRDIIAAAGDPSPLSKKVNLLRGQSFDLANYANLAENVVTDGQDTLKQAQANLETAFRKAVNEEMIQRTEAIQTAVDAVEASLSKWEADVYAASEVLKVNFHYIPKIRVKGDRLRESIM
jgi:predicted transcriptional regulator